MESQVWDSSLAGWLVLRETNPFIGWPEACSKDEQK